MRQQITFFFAFICALTLQAQSFEEYFEDATLRIDYIFAGNAQEQHIYLQELKKQPLWAGRKGRLAEMFQKGNGQVTVKDHDTQRIIYVTTFATLFQEWILDDEAKRVDKAFETSYNVPFPKSTIDVTVTLTDKHQKVTAQLTHTVDPKDILIRPIGDNGIPFRYVWQGQQPLNISECVDLAILAEGYTEAEADKFYHDCQRAADALFEHEPFKSLKPHFNIVAVAAPSQDSGVTIPHHGIWRNTATRSHYDTFYVNRYLMSQDMHQIYDLLAGVPFEYIIVMVNSDKYGGGGIYNQVTYTTSDQTTFKEILVHEFGHGYAGLADEYAYDDMDTEWYPADTEPWEANITTLKDFDSKWADLMPENQPIPTPLDPRVPNYKQIDKSDKKAMRALNRATQVVGVFEGAGYQSKGCYRPAQECRMKINEVQDFCPVCSRAIIRITDFYTKK